MHERKPKLRSVARNVARDPRRSPLFHWLAEHYAELEPATSGPRSDWSPLRTKAIQHGITDDAGNSPSERTVRDTFRKVRQEVAKSQAEGRHKAQPKIQPSRLPVTWRPQAATPPPSSRAVVQPHSGPAADTGTEDRTPDELVAGLRRVMKERSGQ